MKRLSLFILFALSVINVFAQDTLRSKDTITVIVRKINSDKNNANAIQPYSEEVDKSISQNPRSEFSLGITGGISFENNVGMLCTTNIDYLFTPNLSIDASLGDFVKRNPSFYVSFGGKYWFTNKHSKCGFSPYAGLQLDCIGYQIDGGMTSGFCLEVPAGISYISKFGLQASLQLSYYIDPYDFYGPNIEFRIGWRFKTRKK